MAVVLKNIAYNYISFMTKFIVLAAFIALIVACQKDEDSKTDQKETEMGEKYKTINNNNNENTNTEIYDDKW